jgi:hypothetical protein
VLLCPLVFGAALGRPDRIECGVDAHHPPRRVFSCAIGMMAPGQAAMGDCDRPVIGVARDAQDDICVALDTIDHVTDPRGGSAPSTALAGL